MIFTKKKPNTEKALIDELKVLTKDTKELSKEVKNLKNLEFMKVFQRPLKFMWFSFLKGLMIGLGTVLGASVLVAFLVYILAKISFVPVVGDFIDKILTHIETSQQTENDPSTDINFIEQYKQTKETLNGNS
ncbi:MAG: DUF5665 domain-containing protein [Candidatus Peregrinibacteria bacterium]